MQSEPMIPACFRYALVNMSSSTRFSEAGVDWKPVRRDADGWTFANRKNASDERFVSHAAIYNKLLDGEARISYDYDSPEYDRLRAIFGDLTFAEITGKKRDLALFREKMIHLYDADCVSLGRKPRWSKEIFELNLRKYRKRIIMEMLSLDDDNSVRADTMMEMSAFPTPSVKTFRRDYKRYHACGGQVLGIVHRHHGPGLHMRKVDAESLSLAHKEARNYLSDLKPSMAAVYKGYLKELWKANEDRSLPLVKVTRYKFESIIYSFDAFDRWDSRHGRASALKKFHINKRRIEALSVGERVEIDFWKTDLMSLFVETGTWNLLPSHLKEAVSGRRIWFVAAIDAATRYVLAFKATLSPSAVVAVDAIRMIMSDKRHISTLVGAETPWVGMVRPRNIYSDNGSEFANEVTEAAMRAARISFSRPEAGNPKARPFVETLFHVLGPLLTAFFTGQTFRSIAEKGDYDPEQQISLLVDEIIPLLTLGVCDLYHNKPHSGLGGATPHNAWLRATQEHGLNFPSQDAGSMLNIFGKRFKRRIGGYGIVFMGIPYASEELQRQRMKFGQMEFDVKVDPENLATISVKGDEGWFEVGNQVGIGKGLSLAEWIEARNELRKQNAAEAEAGLDAMYRAIDRLRNSGRAAALRANLTPRTLDAEHYLRIESDVFGAWVAVASADTLAVTETFAIPADPLRDGSVSPSTAVPDYHAERRRDGRKSGPRTTAGREPVEQSVEYPEADSGQSYYEEY